MRQSLLSISLSVLMACAATAAQADCSADSAPTRPHLVELYSSEGCSSCPPAEKWLRSMHDGVDVVALEFHVDYWNDLGWPDRFADARYTARQQQQARRDGGSSVFTPQLLLDGRNWSGWFHGGRLGPPEPTALTLHLAAGDVPSRMLRISVAADAAALDAFRGYETFVAIVEDGLSTQVRAGENRGALLRHDHVVRAFAGPLALARAEVRLALPADVVPDRASVVAFAQSADTGKIAQVVALPLAQCRK